MHTDVGNIIKVPKIEESEDTVALSGAAIDALRERALIQQKERREYEALYGAGSWHDTGLIFTDYDGTFLDQSASSRKFKRKVKAAGVPPIRFHDQRHTTATLMYRTDTHPKTMADQLRHAYVSTTLEMYTHKVSPLERRVAEDVSRLVGLGDPEENPKERSVRPANPKRIPKPRAVDVMRLLCDLACGSLSGV